MQEMWRNKIMEKLAMEEIINQKYIRICGKCGVELNKENTGELQWLQPDCNECTKKIIVCIDMLLIKMVKMWDVIYVDQLWD